MRAGPLRFFAAALAATSCGRIEAPPFPSPAAPPASCGASGVPCAAIAFENQMGTPFAFTALTVVLDGTIVFTRDDRAPALQRSDVLAETKRLDVFRGPAAAGAHTVQVAARYEGRCFGVYTYCTPYKFDIKSSTERFVAGGEALVLDIVAYEKGGVTTPLEERPAIRFDPPE